MRRIAFIKGGIEFQWCMGEGNKAKREWPVLIEKRNVCMLKGKTVERRCAASGERVELLGPKRG